MPGPWGARSNAWSARSNATSARSYSEYEDLDEEVASSDGEESALYKAEEEEEAGATGSRDVCIQDDGPLDEDTFGMAVVALVRDSYFLSRHPHLGRCSRLTRIATTLMVLFMTVGFQVFILSEIKRFVSSKAVHDIRNAYEKFENATYLCPEHPENCFRTFTNHNRGRPESKPSEEVMYQRLSSMPETDQLEACSIPLSQPYFFFAVLVVWTTTVLREVRSTYTSTMRIVSIRTTLNMANALLYEDADDDGRAADAAHSHKATIVGLTRDFKIFFVWMQVMRLGIALYLLWIGCRWLLATNQFSDLILNAVALEFVLCLKEMFYTALMPERNKVDLIDTIVPQYPRTMPASSNTFMQTIFYVVVSFVWVILYMRYFQQVLPSYNFDVHAPCVRYIVHRYAV